MRSQNSDRPLFRRAIPDALSVHADLEDRQQRTKISGAFTLVEVVLAIGVLSIAVLSLLLMFAPTMESIQGNIAQTDAIDSTTAINQFLEDQAQENGFPFLFNRFTGQNNEPFYVFTEDINETDDAVVEQLVITGDPDDDNLNGSEGAVPEGRLIGNVLRVELSKVDDNPYDYTDGITDDPVLPMRVTIFQISDPTNPADGGVEAFEYNTAVLR